MARDIFKFLASLKLALILLAVIIVATAMGTIYESKYNGDVAKRLIYSHWWFDLWLLLLGTNLFCVAAIRFPWKSYQTGFVITHGGIIILLLGSWVDRHWGIEGSIGLRCGQPPSNVMELRDQEIRLGIGEIGSYGQLPPAEASGQVGHTTFNVSALLYDADCRFPLNSPDPTVAAEVLNIWAVEPKFVVVPDPDGVPMVNLQLQTPMKGPIESWVALDEQVSMGPLMLTFKRGMPPEKKSAKTKDSEPKQMAVRQERQVVFAKHETLVVPKAGEPTNAKATLKVDEKGLTPELKLDFQGKTFSFKVNDLLKKEQALEGLDKWSIFVYDYFPNYRFDENTKAATTIDDKPENPAVIFELTGPLVPITAAKSTPPHGGSASADSDEELGREFVLTVYLGEDGKMRYHAQRPRALAVVGDLALNKPIDFEQITALEFIPHGRQVRVWEPRLTQENNRVLQLKESNAGALCKVSFNGDVQKVWVPMTQPAKIFEGKNLDTFVTKNGRPVNWDDMYTPVNVGGRKMWLSFAHRTVTLPFGVELRHFNAPNQEGLESSMAFMSFESVLAFEGAVDTVKITPQSKLAVLSGPELILKGAITEENEKAVKMVLPDRKGITIPRSEVVSLDKRTQNAYMNNPTSFPDEWWGPWLGTNYKFSQADHNMGVGDTNYSGLQVLRDPGWSFKWIGCLLICFGIFTMFYLKPYMHGRRKVMTKAIKN